MEGCGAIPAFSKLFTRWYAVETPAIPVPMMTMSAAAGRCAVERCSSSQWGSLRQYDSVGLGTGSIVSAFVGIEPRSML